MTTIFEVVTTRIKSLTGETEPSPIDETKTVVKRVDAYRVKLMFAATYDSYYDELYHYAIFETKAQAESLLEKINKAGADIANINMDYWITGGCVAASSIKGKATKTQFFPAVKF